MATETEQLVVQLEARISDFEKNFKKASDTANKSWGEIEGRGKRASATIEADMRKALAGAGSTLTGIASSYGSSFLGAAGITGLGLSALVASAVKLNGELAKIPGLARLAGLSTDRLQEIKFAGAVKGVGDEAFTTSLTESNKLLDEAQRNVNSLQRLFNANKLSIKDQNGDLIKFDALLEIAAKLMAGTKSETEKLKIAEMLGLSREWIAALRNGPDAFRKSAESAHESGAVIDRDLLEKAKEFDKAWKEAIIKFKAGFTSALTDLSAAFGDFWENLITDVPGAGFIRDKIREWAGGLDGMTLPELQDVLRRSVEQGVGEIEVARIQAEIDRRTGKAPLKLTVTPEIAEPGTTIIPREREKNPFERAEFEARKRIAATDAETRSIGLNSEARERAKLVAELEEAAKKANTEAGFQGATVTDEQRRKIDQLADAMERAAKKQREAQAAFTGWNEALQMTGNIAVDFVDGLTDKTKTLTDLVTSAVSQLKKAALQAAIMGTGPLASLFGTASTSGGTGGIIGAFFNGLTGKADGGMISGPGTGTSDSIVARLSTGEFVVNASATARHHDLLAAINSGHLPRFADGGLVTPSIRVPDVAVGGSTGPAVQNTFNVNVSGGGGTPAQNQDLADKINRNLQQTAQGMVQAEIMKQMRPGGLLKR